MDIYSLIMVVLFLIILFFCFKTIAGITERFDESHKYQRKLQRENEDFRNEIRWLKRDLKDAQEKSKKEVKDGR